MSPLRFAGQLRFVSLIAAVLRGQGAASAAAVLHGGCVTTGHHPSLQVVQVRLPRSNQDVLRHVRREGLVILYALHIDLFIVCSSNVIDSASAVTSYQNTVNLTVKFVHKM